MDRRRFLRHPVQLDVTYQMEREATPSHVGVTRDISSSGMGLRQYNPLRVGHRIFVSLTLPHQGTAHFRGVVVWCAQTPGSSPSCYEAGLRWIKVDPAAQARLDSFLGVLPAHPARGPQRRSLLWGLLMAGLLLLMAGLFCLSLL